MIPESTLDEIRNVAICADVVSAFLPLKREGTNMVRCCPFHDEKSPSFKIDIKENFYKCFGCGKSGGAIEFLQEYKKMTFLDAVKYLGNKYHIDIPDPNAIKTYVRPAPTNVTNLSDAMLDWFKKRKISQRTVIQLQITQSKEWMYAKDKHKEGEVNCINFNYYRNGEIINIKYRDHLKRFKMFKDAELIFYNLDSLQGATEVFITEGEGDTAALIEAGIMKSGTAVLSVPNGANIKTNNLTYIDNCIHLFKEVTLVIIAVDDDVPGRKLREDLAQRFGKERSRYVEWNGLKDANDLLKEQGPEAVVKCCEKQIRFPIEGVFSVDDYGNAIDDMFINGIDRGTSVKTLGSKFDEHLRFVTGWITVITGIPQHGKALALDTLIPTVNGWTTMGEVKVGDPLFDEQGKPCSVIAVTDVMHDRQCYKMTFDDGSTVIADEQHKWLTTDFRARWSARNAKVKNRQKELRLRGTDQIHKRTFPSVKTTLDISTSLTAEKGKRFNHLVLSSKPIFLPSKDLLIPPYVLGAWLGDGRTHYASITITETPIRDKIIKLGQVLTEQPSGRGIQYGMIGFMAKLRHYNLIGNKRIPCVYLRSSYKQRLELLRGIMDTDGHCDKIGRCELTTIKEKFANDAFELITSLGIKTSISVGNATLNGRFISKKYRLAFVTKINVFSLERKSARLTTRDPKKNIGRYIVNCEKTESVPVRCIQVDSPSSLFLCTKSFIPTHNSDVLDQILLGLMLHHNWKGAIYSPENDPFPLHFSKLARKLIGKPWFGKNDIINEQEKNLAKRFLLDKMWIIKPPKKFTLETIVESVIRIKEQYGIKWFVIDAWNRLEHKYGKGQMEAQYVQESLIYLDTNCRHHDIHCFLVAHPTKLVKEKGGSKTNRTKFPIPTMYDISGGAHFFNIPANGISVYRDFEEGITQLHIQKVKFIPYWGTHGRVDLKYDIESGRFNETAGDQVIYDKSNWITKENRQAEIKEPETEPFMRSILKDGEEFPF